MVSHSMWPQDIYIFR